MKCELCSESNVEPDHEISEQHLKNKALHDYSVHRKQLSGNRRGITVKCSVRSSVITITDCVNHKIQISTKPNEEIKFNFHVSNDNKKECVFINYIQIPPNKLNFVMNDHNLGYGCAAACLKPRTPLKQDIFVKFKCADIGQYNMPIIFSCYKDSKKDTFCIVREMTVYVERNLIIHEEEPSPYSNEEVMADILVKTTAQNNCDSEDEFRIPRHYKNVYATGLKVSETAPDHFKAVAQDIRDVFSTGITKENYIRFFHNLLWYEETIVRINLKKYNMSGVSLTREFLGGDALKLFVPGLAEKRPSLMLGDSLFVKPQKTDRFMFEGVISDIYDSYINIRGLDGKFWKFYSPLEKFDIRFFMSRWPLERMHLAVDSIIRAGMEERVFPEAPKKNARKPEPIVNYYNLQVQENPEQRLAVEHIVAGSSGTAPYLLHGPPGTGKTVTIVEAILQIVHKNPKNRVMVCTDSNMAADHVATVLIRYAHLFPPNLLLRASSKYRVWETLPQSLVKYSNGSCYNSFEAVSIDEFMSYRIVITTLSHAAKFVKQFGLRKQRPITHLLIDEAAQASEPATLIPLCGLLDTTGSLVLAGDPLQLGPVVISNNARLLGLGLSLMERLMQTCPLYSAGENDKLDPNYTVMLRNNFRSDADILHIPNQLFYKGQLRAHAAEDKLSNKDILGKKMESRAIVFHGVLSQEQKMGKSPSFFNNMELEIVQMYITLLMKNHGVLPEDIGVVTPYIRQVYKIKTWLATKNLKKLEVGTVEAFQGKEKRVILVSTVRASCGLLDHDAKFRLGFLVDDKRFNVALTRAKAKAIIIGNPLCLEKDVKWRTYIERCRELGTYVGFDSRAAPDAAAQKDVLQRITPMLNDLKLKGDV
ncbi:hypothetical protein ABMA28_007831 [Loxostege sticticalis]|uniref:RNA helicase n=1 Tax=Loxostege sticticalis TaxID=481309 RepID=A0ABD0SIX2_LOXSC